MGLFGRKKKSKEEHHAQPLETGTFVGGFTGFALLSEADWDKERFIADFKDDWGIEIIERDSAENPDDDKTLIYAEIDGLNAMAGFVEAPVPNGEAEYWAQGNYMWKDGVDVVKTHKAQLIISVFGQTDDIITKSMLFVKLAATAMKQKNAIAFYNDGAVFPPDMYRTFCEPMMKNGEFPLLNLVWFGIYGNEVETGIYTYGLRRLGKEEIEVYVPRETADLNEIRVFAANVADYVINENVTLRDGETIGFTAEQKLPIHLSKGIALDGNTLKIAYGE